MRILLCNDDGIYAQGIKELYHCLSEIAEVTVVAPLEERSATGQTLTLDHPVRIQKIKSNHFGTTGYPADCSLLGIIHIMQERPDIVISGINYGANLGQDIYYSGTVAAARQGTFHKIPSIAISTVLDDSSDKENINYKSAAKFLKLFIEQGYHTKINEMEMLNINVPDCPYDELQGIEITELGMRYYSEEIKERKDFKNRNYYWIGGRYEGHSNKQGSDCVAIDARKVSITPLKVLADSTDSRVRWSDIIKNLNI